MSNDFNNYPYNPEPQAPPTPPQAPGIPNGYTPDERFQPAQPPQEPQVPQYPQYPQPPQEPQYPQPPQEPQIPQYPQPPQPPQIPQEPQYPQYPQPPQPPQAPQYPQPPQAQGAPQRYYQPQPAPERETPPFYGAPSQQYQQYRTPYQPQKQPMSTGLKAFLATIITFLVVTMVGFVIFVSLNPSDGGFREETSPTQDYSFTFPSEKATEPTTEGREYPESNAQNATDPSYKGLPTQSKPSKVKKGEYGSAYAFEKVEKSVVGVLCYVDGQEGTESSYTTMGSGIVISKDGYIITNSHIIGNSRKAYKFKVVTSDKKEYKAGVVGYDSRNDIAVLKVDAKNLTPAQFGNSDELKVTEDIIIVGNPLGINYQNSVTKGIISALDRKALSSNNAKVIQTDAAINPGNSGGPMVNMYGQVVGVATAKVVLDDYEGMAFAIPGNTVKKLVDSIIRDGYVKGRVRIGIVGQAVTTRDSEVAGIEIQEVSEGGPLDGRDVREGDILTEVDGEKIKTFSDCYSVLEKHKPNDKVKVKIFRPSTNSSKEIEITLQEDKAE